jgi:WXG100 family type VII secretion target
MESVAGKFETVHDSLDAMLSRLINELQVLETSWVGKAGTSFTAVRDAYQVNQRKLGQALAETAVAIRTSGTNYTATDDASSSKVSNIDTTVNLPL